MQQATNNQAIREVAMSGGLVAVVDAADYELVSPLRWRAQRSGATTYAVASSRHDGKATGVVLMHRLITGCPDGLVVDHIDFNGLNNQRENLRVCTRAQNTTRRRTRCGETGYRGVRRNGRASFSAVVTKSKMVHTFGPFTTAERAAAEYDRKAADIHGEFALTNGGVSSLTAGPRRTKPIKHMDVNLRARRIEQGKSLADMATELGVSVAAVAEWETGKANPLAKRVPSVAAAYGIEVRVLAEQTAAKKSRRRRARS